MIVRLWKGRVPADRAEEYKAYQEEVGPPGYAKLPGNLGIYMIGRTLGDEYEIAMLTFWDTIESVKSFTGDAVDKAKYYERDFEFLIDPPEKVEIFEVLSMSNLP